MPYRCAQCGIGPLYLAADALPRCPRCQCCIYDKLPPRDEPRNFWYSTSTLKNIEPPKDDDDSDSDASL